MLNMIPDHYLFNSALYKNIERNVMAFTGVVDDDLMISALTSQQRKEENPILCDIYTQIITHLQMRKTTSSAK